MNQNVKIVFDRKKQVETTGIGKIEIYIYLARKEKKYEVVGEADVNTWETIALNKNIQAKMKHYEQIINAMKMLNEEMTVENFNEHVFTEKHPKRPDETHLYDGHDQRQSFVEFCRDHLAQENLAKNSIKGFNVVFDSVEASGILNTLADLTTANVVAYDAYLRRQKDKSDYTIHGYHKKIGKYCRLLWQLEMIPSNPYDHVKFPKGSNKERNPLNEEELLKIRNADLTGYLAHTRDLFIFMAYTGLAYCDMAQFNYKTMTEDCKDYTYIDGSRLKTGSKFFTTILPPAMEVLKKYNYKLPIITNQKINMYSHVIEAQLNIKKPVTCHIARHSFATLMLSYGFSLEEVKKMLGHKDIKTTQIYAKLSNKVLEESVTNKLKMLK
jgi:site-specific recombinase XerD